MSHADTLPPARKPGVSPRWLGRFVRRQRVRQADGSLYYTAHITIGRLRAGVGWAQNLPHVRGILRYVFCWRHPGNLYAPHYQCRILWAAVGFRILPPNTKLTDGYRRTGPTNQPKSERR